MGKVKLGDIAVLINGDRGKIIHHKRNYNEWWNPVC